jgi:uncharacterized protein (TIGR03643 family)
MTKVNLPKRTCVSCQRLFSWRKKWESTWESVQYCSKRCESEVKPALPDVDRIVRMGWEDRTPFQAILNQFGLNESQAIEVMRKELTPTRFRAWRKRVHQHGNLKDSASRGFELGRFKCSLQRTDGTTKNLKKTK